MGTAVALPFLDAMTPALAQSAERQSAGAHGVRLRAERHGHAALEPELRRQARRAAADAAAARGAQGRHPADGQPDAQHGTRAARRRRRSRPLLRLVPDRRAGEEERQRHQGERLVRPARRQPDRPARRGLPRSKSGSKTAARRATATPATPAPTPTTSRGAARRSRCRRFSIRARCSSGCSATARSSRPKCASSAESTAAASSTSSAKTRGRCTAALGPTDQRKLDEYLELDPPDRRAAEARRDRRTRRSIRAWRSRTASRATSPSTSG